MKTHSILSPLARPILTLLGAVGGLFLMAGCGVPSFLVTPVSGSSELQEQVVRDGKGWHPKKVLLLEVEGMLVNAKSGGLLQPTENDLSLFVQQLERAERDRDVAAIVLRVNSPGGTVTTSDTMYQTLMRFKQRTGRPIVASAQEVAASGAYYVSCAADKIVAHPTSIVGSIGVIFNSFDASGTMQKIGLRSEAIKSGPLKDMGSIFKPLTDPEREVMQGMVNEDFARFVDLVKTRRGISDPATLQLVTDGRVFNGERARQLGLVDQTGLLDDAIDLAAKMANAPSPKVILYKRPYGYSGSIYAKDATPRPQANVLQLNLPPSRATLPTGLYYLWEPGL